MNRPALDLLAIGEPMIEFNRTRTGDGAWLQGFGGDSSNLIVAASRSGARCGYLSRVGDDAFGQALLALWRDEGVDASTVTVDPDAHTAVYFVEHGADGHRFAYLRRDSAASRMTPRALPADIGRRAAITCASGISLAISAGACDTVLAAFGAARAAGGRVALDANLRERLWPLPRARAIIGAAAALADYFLPSVDDAIALSGLPEDADPRAVLDWALGLGAGTVVLKLGARGVIASDGGQVLQVGGHRVDSVDATGAGDCFCGAFLARISAGDALEPALRYANAAAALATTGYGAVAPLPRPDAVARLLART
ncbi:MAG: sugar kinase [Lautropia sp.]